MLEYLENRLFLSAPYGIGFDNTSDYMLGDIVANVILVESDGTKQTQSENWNLTEINNVKNEITNGLKWWESVYATQRKTGTYAPNFIIDFTYADNPINVGLEPIKNNYTSQADWITDSMNFIGIDGSNVFSLVREFNNQQRDKYNADWSYTIFVVDSSADTDGKFTDGYFAYAYLGGPFMTMTYDNANWGIGNMDKVTAHETGHIFYSLDEYPGSSSFYDRSGYLNIQNTNAYDNNPNKSSRVASIMAEASLQNTAWTKKDSSPASKHMIGWGDSDKDGIMDILDVPHSLSGNAFFDNGVFYFNGQSNVNVLENKNPKQNIFERKSSTLNTIDGLQYRINDGEWLLAQSLNQLYTENINFNTTVNEQGFSS